MAGCHHLFSCMNMQRSPQQSEKHQAKRAFQKQLQYSDHDPIGIEIIALFRCRLRFLRWHFVRLLE